MKANQNYPVTDPDQAEVALRESEEIMQYIVRHDPNAIAIYDCNLHYLAVSERYLHDYEVKEEDIIGKHHYEVFPEMPQKWKDVHQRCLAGAIERDEDDWFVRPDGSITYNRWECRPWRRANGQIGGIITYTEVTTDRKKAEKQLSESEIKYRAFFENSMDAMLLTSPDGKTHSVNQAACRMFGYSEEALIEMGRSGIEDATDPRLSALLAERKLKGKALGEVTFIRKDGTRFPAEISTSLFQNKEGFDRSSMIIRDITERKKAEDTLLQLSSAVEQTIDTIAITDLEGKIQYVNHAFEILTGYSSHEAVGKTPRILKSGLKGQKYYTGMWNTILAGKVFRAEVVNKKKNGQLFYEQKTISPIFDKNKNITHFVGTGVDISDRKLAENELIKAKEKAEESDRLKSAFLANMSHEIRTPLNSIIGFSELLANPDFGEEDKKEFIGHIVTSGNNLLTIINDIMDISKMESGEITIHKSQVNAPKFISGIRDQFSLQVEAKNLELKLILPDTVEETFLVADEDRLSQIFNNLMSNALKFTAKGTIEIGYHPRGHLVEFYVKDTGIGIATAFHDKIFERFRQVEDANTRTYGGNGLGLAISKNLVELMGGTIGVKSQSGKGSEFYFTIPVMIN